MSEAPDEDPEGTGLVSELTGDLGGAEVIGEEGPKGLILALARVGRLEKEALFLGYRIFTPLFINKYYYFTQNKSRLWHMFYTMVEVPFRRTTRDTGRGPSGLVESRQDRVDVFKGIYTLTQYA